MPLTPSVYHPDPNKWIDTGKSTKKPPPQRPLTAIRHGLYTPPPSSIRRGKTTSRDDSPVVKQVGLSGYMTPPTTGPTNTIRPKYDRLQKRIAEELKDTPTNVKAKVTEKKLDDFWGSSDSEPGPSTRRNGDVHDVVDLTRDDRDEHAPPIRAGLSKSRKSQDPSPTVAATPLPLASQPIQSSHLAPIQSPLPSPIPEDLLRQTTSPPCPITPIPHSVLAEHRRLCGQGTDQQERIRTSWRGDAHPSPSRKTSKKSPPSKQINSRVKAIAKDKENKRVKRGLVQLSDEESEGPSVKPKRESQQAGEVLRSLKVNAGSREFVYGFTSPKKPRQGSIYEGVSVVRRQSVSGALTVDKDDTIHIFEPIQPAQATRSPSPTPERSLSPRLSLYPESPSTPRKDRGIGIKHHITPPKSRSPKRITDHRETLFAFPSPARARIASSSRSPSAQGWEPVEWDHAETLMVWGPETMRQSLTYRPVVSELPSDVGADMARPEPSPVQHRRKRRTFSDASESESLAPSIPSQSFPNLVRSSPQKRNSTVLQPEPEVVEEYPVEMPCKQPQPRGSASPGQSFSPAAHKSPTTRSTALRTDPKDRWRILDQGILSVPVPAPTSEQKTPIRNSQSRKRKSNSGSQGQTKLAAFGFFPDPPPLHARPSHVAFEKEWEAEENLEEAEDEELLSSPRAGSPRTSENPLARVPEAPFHPALRPAGIAELRRRQKRTSASKSSSPLTDLTRSSPTPIEERVEPARPTMTSHKSSSDDSSSLTSEDPLFPENRAEADRAREWFEEIGNRRSSEFGSFRST